jgi:hypothetical protein
MTSLETDIKVFKDCSIFDIGILGQSSNETAFEVELAIYGICGTTNTLYGVCHHDQVHWIDVFKLHREDTIDTSQERFRVTFNVIEVVLEHILEGLELSIIHSLYDKLFVLAKEEEAARFAL